MFVVGPAKRPGVYTLPSQSTLLSAVVAAGGPAPNGSMRRVLLRRDGKVVSELDVYEFLVQGDKSRDVQLAAGDVVVFQPAGAARRADRRARHAGHLRTEERRRSRCARCCAMPAARRCSRTRTGPSSSAWTRRSRAARFVEEFRLDGAGLQKPLRDGDVLTLLAISPEFANAVTLKGHVAQPLRYPFTPGMRIRDLIPDREALISPDFYRRKNLLVQVIDDDDDAPRDRRNDDRDRSTAPSGSDRTARGLPAAPTASATASHAASQARRRVAATATRDDAPTTRSTPHDGASDDTRSEPSARARRPRRGRALAAHAGGAVRRTELGLRGDRAAERPT